MRAMPHIAQPTSGTAYHANTNQGFWFQFACRCSITLHLSRSAPGSTCNHYGRFVRKLSLFESKTSKSTSKRSQQCDAFARRFAEETKVTVGGADGGVGIQIRHPHDTPVGKVHRSIFVSFHQITDSGYFAHQRDEDKVVLLDQFQDSGRWNTIFHHQMTNFGQDRFAN
jgi:hypothetical protein